MFAIIEDGSRQYRVENGRRIRVDYRADAENGGKLTFDRVLLAGGGAEPVIGLPLISGAVVEAEVVEALTKGPKLEVQKLRRRKNSRRHTGHRQKFTTVLVTAIDVPGLKVVEQSADESPARPAEEDANEG
jgi:large subunit ribosomal protein L21